MSGRLHQRVANYYKSDRSKARLVYVHEHFYMRGERISNWATFSDVDAQGKVATAKSGDYDFGSNFEVLPDMKVQLQVAK